MLDALLATIGTLGILATLALGFGKACTEALVRNALDRHPGQDPAPVPAPVPVLARVACPHRRLRRRTQALRHAGTR